MSKWQQQPVALTIAGSDSGGGAGIQADLKTFAALGVHGTTAITCLTAQNPKSVRGIQAARPEMVREQIAAVFDAFAPRAVKTGMLFSAEIIQVVLKFYEAGERPPLIVDPVMVSTSGTSLLKPSAVKLLQNHLLPLATLVTPNVSEAEMLTGHSIESVDDLRCAAREIEYRYGCAALVKGGHLRGLKVAVDFYYDGETELMLTAPFIKGLATHGTGCTYSAAITGYMALGHPLPRSVELGKTFITEAIRQHTLAGTFTPLNSFWKP